MKLSTMFQAKGMVRVVKGTVKELIGKVTSNTMLRIEGRFERITGNVQRKIGRAQGLCGL
jgi:uncharacterized protein YjbJ (UPF0337 family)